MASAILLAENVAAVVACSASAEAEAVDCSAVAAADYSASLRVAETTAAVVVELPHAINAVAETAVSTLLTL